MVKRSGKRTKNAAGQQQLINELDSLTNTVDSLLGHNIVAQHAMA